MPEPVTEDAWRIDLDQVNAYILKTSEGPVLVDTGLPGGEEAVRRHVRATGQAPEELAAVLVTHTDLDHVGNLASLVEGTRASIHLSPTAANVLDGGARLPWLSTKGLFQRLTGLFVDPPDPQRFDTVEEGDSVLGFRVVETPGHGLGHLAFGREDGLVFVGDLVRLDEDQPRLSPAFVNYDTDQARRSLEHMLETLEEIAIVCAGHGEPMVDDARERLERLLD